MFVFQFILKVFLLVCASLSMQAPASAKPLKYEIIIKDHKFIPDKIEVPAGVKITLHIHNQDNTVEEFESFELKREKIIVSNGKARIPIGPLKPGEYKFFGEFHEETAQGVIIAKEEKKEEQDKQDEQTK